MGQQQLLLVILVTIIVGVATVVAINIFGQSAENANIDATRQDILTMGAQMQGYAIKPALMGGGSGTFTGLTVDKIGFGYDSKESDTKFTNGNATYSFAIAADKVTITATPTNLDATEWNPSTFTAEVTKGKIDITAVPKRGTATTTGG